MSLPLLDGQGNFGSMDGDNPAAMRYTEVRMDKPAAFMLADIEKETVDFQDNYDGKDKEPTVLPARFPNMLVNGAGGIAVGMATNIPPHNLGEVINATLALIEDPDLTSEQLIDYVPGPDFPTGAVMLGRSGARKAYLEGRGSVVIRAKTRVEEIRKDRYAIVVDEIPYQVNKASMIEKIAEQVREKRIEGVSHVQDESDRNGVRVVVELKRDATAEVVLNQLFRFTPMQTSFGCNMLALNGGRPEQLTLRKFLTSFIDFREDVVARRTAFNLRKARERSHVLCGLAVAVSNVDEVVATIRSSADAAEARHKLMTRRWPAMEIAPYIRLIDDPTHTMNEDGTYNLSEVQARAILELRLQRLTQLGVKEVTDELEELAGKIKEYLEILSSRERIMGIIADELTEVRESFAVPRRTEIVDWSGDMEDEDLIEREDMVVTVTSGGYIKRTPLADFRSQRRGGKGRAGMSMKDEDYVTTVFVATTHTPVLFFSSTGMSYKLKVWKLPLGGPNTRGKALVNILPLGQDEQINSIMALPEDEESWKDLDIMFASRSGGVRRNSLSDFTRVNRNGKIAMKPDEGDGIVDVRVVSEDDDILLTTLLGKTIRFRTTDARRFNSRASTGVRGIKLVDGDEVISMAVLRHLDIETDERNAYLKRSNAERRALGDEVDSSADDTDESEGEAMLTDERYAQLSANEQFVLTIADDGLGKRSSSYRYKVQNRGGGGLKAQTLTRGKNKPDAQLVRSFIVEDDDQIMLVTDGGQLIRTPVRNISISSRSAKGVWVIRTKEDEKVVSVGRIEENDDGEEGDEGAAPGADTP